MIKLKYTTVLPRRFITTLRSIKNLSPIMLSLVLEGQSTKNVFERKSITCEMREFLIKKKHSRAFVSLLHLLLKPHSSCEAAVPEVVDLVDLAAAGRLVLVVSEEEEEEEDDLLDRLPFRMRRRIETMRYTIQTTKATKRIIIIIISIHSSNQKPPNSS